MGFWGGSQYVAHDYQDLGMTHMFNVGYSIPDAVTDMSYGLCNLQTLHV